MIHGIRYKMNDCWPRICRYVEVSFSAVSGNVIGDLTARKMMRLDNRQIAKTTPKIIGFIEVKRLKPKIPIPVMSIIIPLSRPRFSIGTDSV